MEKHTDASDGQFDTSDGRQMDTSDHPALSSNGSYGSYSSSSSSSSGSASSSFSASSPPSGSAPIQSLDGSKAAEGLSLDEEEGGTLKLIPKQDTSQPVVSFDVDRKNAFISTLIKTSVEQEKTVTEVPVPGVESAILEKILKYMNHHKGVEPPIIEKPLRSKVMKDVCKDPWDADFIDTLGENRQELYDLILVCNHQPFDSLDTFDSFHVIGIS